MQRPYARQHKDGRKLFVEDQSVLGHHVRLSLFISVDLKLFVEFFLYLLATKSLAR